MCFEIQGTSRILLGSRPVSLHFGGMPAMSCVLNKSLICFLELQCYNVTDKLSIQGESIQIFGKRRNSQAKPLHSLNYTPQKQMQPSMKPSNYLPPSPSSILPPRLNNLQILLQSYLLRPFSLKIPGLGIKIHHRGRTSQQIYRQQNSE